MPDNSDELAKALNPLEGTQTGPKGISERQIVAALNKHGGILARAAKELGCSRENLRQRIDRSDSLQAAIKNVDELILDIAESRVIVAIEKEKDTTTARWLLIQKGRARGYGNKTETEVRIPDEQFTALTDAIARGDASALRALRAGLASATGQASEATG